MDLQPLISIIMPAYNAGDYLEACLDSIRLQSYVHWELIIVNDFSVDNTDDILKDYCALDQRIQYHNNVEKGIISALQLGYSFARGSYISRMDADDLMPRNKLELLLDLLLSKGKKHIATGKVKYFSEGALGNGFIRYADWLNSFCASSSHFEDRYKECVIASPAWLIRRDDFDGCGGFENDTYPEDYDLVFRFFKGGLKVVSTNEIVHLWRDHGQRASRNDPNYKDNNFFSLKIQYFIDLDYDSLKTLNIIGAGKKGKEIARRLKDNNISYDWYTNNPKKIGVNIYDLILKNQAEMPKNGQVIIAVSNTTEIEEIIEKMRQNKRVLGKDYFVFV